MAEDLKKKPSCLVRFLPDGAEARVPGGTSVMEAALAAGIYLNSSCAGEGVCGRCRVEVVSGPVKTEPTGRLTPEEVKAGCVLSCRATVHGDAEIRIPPSSRLAAQQVEPGAPPSDRLSGIFSPAGDAETGAGPEEISIRTHSPLSARVFLKLPPPTLDDHVSDLERLYRGIRAAGDYPHLQTGLANVRKLGRLLRESNWEVTALLGKRNSTVEIVSVEPGDTSAKNFGVACDIGTTTISAELVDLNTKETLSRKAAYNRQAACGEDVITRMIYAGTGDGLEKLHHLVIDVINSLVSSMASENGIPMNEITAVMCAGNTTMVHLLLRVEPSYIRKEPYVPTANFMPVIRAAEAGIKIHPRGLLACIPGVSSYVGGDISAGALASGIYDEEHPALFIDVGTNGEVVLGCREWLSCCASSAGPAFEGSGVACGVRAMRGAIQEFVISPSGEVSYVAIGGEKPIGFCGSGYIECLAEFLKAGVIDRSGRFSAGDFSGRLREGPGGREFVAVFGKESADGGDIVVTQPDIDNLLRSKAAVYAAQRVLVGKMGLAEQDIGKVYLSGGFGSYINVDKAVVIGLLPDLPREKFSFLGNSSLAGAKFSLLSREAFGRAEEIARNTTNIELSVDAGFMNEFTASVFLPHTDMSRFPSAANQQRRKNNERAQRPRDCPEGGHQAD